MEPDTLTFPVLNDSPQDPTGPAPAGESAALVLMCFQVDGQEYGLPLSLVREIRRVHTSTPLPGQDAASLGAMNFRGEAIPLLDLRRLLGLPDTAKAVDDQRAVVVLAHRGRHVGMVVDDVVDVLRVQPEELRSLPPLPGDIAPRHLPGVILAGVRHVLLLDPSEWLAAYASPAA